MNQIKIGSFIKEQRLKKGLTQIELADKLRVSNRTISKWENGNSLPDYSIFNDLCNELDISISELFAGEKLSEENYKEKLEERFILIDKNKIKRKRTFKVILIFFFLIIIYLSYKSYTYYYFVTRYSNDYQENTFPYNDNITDIEIKENDKANIYINDDLKIYIPDNYKLITDKKESHFVKDDCDVFMNNLKAKEFDSAIIICNNDFDNIINFDHFGINNSKIPYLDTYSTLKKNKINDVIDLLKYYEKHYKDKLNIFTSSNKLKMHYIARQYILLNMPTYDNFYYLNGDLRGYLLSSKRNNDISSHYQINFYYKENNNIRSYSISLINNKKELIDDKEIINIISSISIEKE